MSWRCEGVLRRFGRALSVAVLTMSVAAPVVMYATQPHRKDDREGEHRDGDE